jgi:hypothetical protein
MQKITSRRVVAFGVVGALLVIIAVAFFPPPARDVHTPGASPLDSRLVSSNPTAVYFNGHDTDPSAWLDTTRCELWHSRHRLDLACPDSAALAAEYFPNLTQTPQTLYIPWLRCYLDGALFAGFNLEYQPIRGAIVIHCYTAQPWIHWRHVEMAARPQPELLMLVVSTKSLSLAEVVVIEDDRVERYGGYDSTEFSRGRAIISGR